MLSARDARWWAGSFELLLVGGVRTCPGVVPDLCLDSDSDSQTHVIVKDVNSGELSDVEVEGAFVKVCACVPSATVSWLAVVV